MAKNFELEGTLQIINEIQTFASGFSKREFVVEVADGNYPQMIKFECVKEKTALTDGLNTDEQVKVTFDIRGNEYNGRYYVNLNAWKLEKVGGGSAAPADGGFSDPEAPPSHLNEPPGGHGQEADDDIPF